MTNFTEFEFKLSNGVWVKACFDSSKVKKIMDEMSIHTEVRTLSTV